MTDWLFLKSGSDVRGTAVGDNATLTADIAKALGMAFAQWVAAKKNKTAQTLRIAIGRDSRITGPGLLQAVADGIIRCGASVSDFGMCTTPAMYMSTITPGFEADGAVMITASHHPWDKNGLKFFTSEGGLESKDVETLLRVARDLKPEESSHSGSTRLSFRFIPKISCPYIRSSWRTESAAVSAQKPTSPLPGSMWLWMPETGQGAFMRTCCRGLVRTPPEASSWIRTGFSRTISRIRKMLRQLLPCSPPYSGPVRISASSSIRTATGLQLWMPTERKSTGTA